MFRRQRRKIKRAWVDFKRGLSDRLFRRSRKATQPLQVLTSVVSKLFLQLFDTNNFRFFTRPIGAFTKGLFNAVAGIATGLSNAVGRSAKSFAATVNGLIPRSLLAKLAAPFKAVGGFLGMMLSVIWAPIRDQLLESPLVKWVIAKLKPLWYPFVLLGSFVVEWFKTRQLSQIYGGIPALALLAFAMLLATKMAYSNTASIVRRYRDLSFKAAEENDLATVSLCTRKLQQLGVSTDQSEYFAAIKLEEDNKISEAVERMQQLAGLERARDGELGFAPAHYWMASRLLNGAIELPRAAQLAQAEEHLKYFDDLEPESSASDGLWAQVYSATGRLTLSTERLRKLVDRVPELSFDLFSMSLIAGDLTNARQDALKLKKHFETLDYKAFSVLEFIRWAQAHEITSDLAGARSVLGKGREVWPDNQQLAVLAGRSSLAQYDSIANIQSAPAERRVQLLQDALSTKAVDKDVMQRVAYLYRQRNSSRIADLTLTRLLEDANTPGTIHLHLGSAAAMEGDTETARKLMQRSLELAPDSPLAHNNYAWLQSNSEPLNLPAALKLINRAVELDPVDYRFRETRGKIYLAMEDWEKAVEDLEYAINGLPNLEGVHESLASAYRKLGKTELALAHEAEAKPKQ